MTVTRLLYVSISLGFVCTGCVSFPFIDDSLAKLDANPVDVTTRFNLPQTPPLPIEPQTADMLVGDWMTGFHNVVCRKVNEDGEIYNYEENYKGVAEVYGFEANGNFAHNDIGQLYGLLLQIRKSGTWSYDSGVLTLHFTKGVVKHQNFAAKSRGELNWSGETELKIDYTDTYRIEWFAYDEIAIHNCDETPPPQNGSRESVKVDAYGVKQKREIKVVPESVKVRG